MKIVLKKVYYCEFCKKKGLSSGAMKIHELHCTSNLDRLCRMCGEERNYREIFKELIGDQNRTESLYKVLELYVECPTCILTLLKMMPLKDDFSEPMWDYKSARDKWWTKVNSEYHDEDGGYY